MDTNELMNTMSPNVRRAWNHKVEEMRLATRIIFDYELLYVERGELTLRVNHEIVTAVPGDIILFKPGIQHEFIDSEGECWMPHIHFDVLYYEDFEEVPINFKPRSECSLKETQWIRPDLLGSVLKFPFMFRIGNHTEVLKTLMQIIHAYERRDPEFPILQKSLVLRIIYLLIKGMKAKNNTQLLLHQGTMERTVTYMMEHYNENIPLHVLSKIACLSVYHFSRIFKQTYGLSPHQFQMRYRIDKSKEFMMFGQMSLSSIAERIGYSTIHSFSKAFKQMEGIPPKQYIATYSYSNKGSFNDL